jgi:hypothetical protein
MNESTAFRNKPRMESPRGGWFSGEAISPFGGRRGRLRLSRHPLASRAAEVIVSALSNASSGSAKGIAIVTRCGFAETAPLASRISKVIWIIEAKLARLKIAQGHLYFRIRDGYLRIRRRSTMCCSDSLFRRTAANQCLPAGS